MYLCWWDDNPKKTQAAKIQEAVTAYRAKFGTEPTEILVNEAELVEVAGLNILVSPFIRKSTIWVGVA